jgi:hypothetical protein
MGWVDEMAQVEITLREWRWLAVAALAVMLVTFVPYAVGWLASTPEMRYGGFIYAHEDMHSYLAKMRFGARDGWLFELVYTSEPHRGAIVFPFHLALGKLTAWLAGNPPPVPALVLTYHLARWVCGLFVLAVTYRFIAEFLADVGQRRLAWTLVALGGGLGWLILLLFGPEWLGGLPNEYYIPEGYTFLTLLALPHLALARGLLLMGWLALLRAAERPSWRLAVGAGLAWFAMGVLVPFYVALVDVLLAVWLVALWLRTRRLPLREGLLAALAGALSGLTLAYNFWAFTSDPVFRVWSAQNLLPSPHPLHYVAGYGVLAVLAAFGLGPFWRGEARRAALLVSWPLVVPALVYLPINVQRRLAEGVLVPLSILAVAGFARLAAGWRPRRRSLASAVLLALLVPSLLVMVLGGVLSAARPRWPMYHSRDELAALAWLEERAPPDSVVLSSFEQGNVLPAYADVRVYAGHGPETVDSGRKKTEVRAFFGAGMTDDQRLALLAESHARYVFFGPAEAALCDGSACFNPDALGLERAYSAGDYAIYEVVR